MEFGRSADPAEPEPSRRASSQGESTDGHRHDALRSLVNEREIPFEVVVEAIERALETAYHHTPGAQPKARVELDRSTGHVTVFAAETDEDGEVVREWDDTPEGFGRVAATTARQVILQRLRDAEDEATFGAWSGREGDLVSGVIQQGPDPQMVLVDLGPLEAQLPAAEQVPGEQYVHGERLRCYVVGVRKGGARADRDGVAHPPGSGQAAVRARGARDRRRLGRDRGDRPRGRAPHQDRRALAQAGARTPRAPASGRWARGCAR